MSGPLCECWTCQRIREVTGDDEATRLAEPNPLTVLLRTLGVIGPEQRAEVDPEPELMMDPGEGLLW